MCRAGRQSLPWRRSRRSLEYTRPGPRAWARRRRRRCTCQPDRSSERSRRQGLRHKPWRRLGSRSQEGRAVGVYSCVGRESADRISLVRYFPARVQQTASAGKIDNLCPRGSRPGDGDVGPVRRERAHAPPRTPVRAGWVSRRRTGARNAVHASRVDDLCRGGGRSGHGNISARGRERGRAGARAAVRASRIDRRSARARAAVRAGGVSCRRARAPLTVSARRVYKVSSGSSLMVIAGSSAHSQRPSLRY